MRTCQLIFLNQHSTPVTLSVTAKEHTHSPFSCIARQLLIREETSGSRGRNCSFQSDDTMSRPLWSRSTSVQPGLMSWGTPGGRQAWVLGPQEAGRCGCWDPAPCFPGAGAKCQLITTLFPCLFYGNSADRLIFLGIKD